MSARQAHPPRAWPLSEEELAVALDRLEVLRLQARENVALQGREAGEARVLLEHWRKDLAARRIWPARFRLILAEAERRHLVVIDGPFAATVDPRPHLAQMAGARA